MPEETADDGIIAAAEFSNGFIVYFWIIINLLLAISVIGILVNIFWIPFGWFVHKKQLEKASLT